jgi:hypothetical protein
MQASQVRQAQGDYDALPSAAATAPKVLKASAKHISKLGAGHVHSKHS